MRAVCLAAALIGGLLCFFGLTNQGPSRFDVIDLIDAAVATALCTVSGTPAVRRGRAAPQGRGYKIL